MAFSLIGIFFLAAVVIAVLVVVGIIVALVMWGSYRKRGSGMPSQPRHVQNIDQSSTESIQGIDEIEISTASTEVSLLAVPQGDMGLHFYGEASGRDENSLPKLMVQPSSRALNIKIDYPLNDYNRTRLDIQIPEGFGGMIKVRTASGGIHMKGLNLRELRMESASGGVNVEESKAGKADFRTASGGIRVRGVDTENAAFGTASGAIQAERVSGALEAHTASGSISLKMEELKSAIRTKSASGSIEVLIPQDAQFKVSARSVSGSISSGFSFAVEQSPGFRRMEGQAGSGEYLVDLESVSGSIRLRQKLK